MHTSINHQGDKDKNENELNCLKILLIVKGSSKNVQKPAENLQYFLFFHIDVYATASSYVSSFFPCSLAKFISFQCKLSKIPSYLHKVIYIK